MALIKRFFTLELPFTVLLHPRTHTLSGGHNFPSNCLDFQVFPLYGSLADSLASVNFFHPILVSSRHVEQNQSSTFEFLDPPPIVAFLLCIVVGSLFSAGYASPSWTC